MSDLEIEMDNAIDMFSIEPVLERTVLRSIYLPESLDERLRVIAFREKKTKGELIRELLEGELNKRYDNTRRDSIQP